MPEYLVQSLNYNQDNVRGGLLGTLPRFPKQVDGGPTHAVGGCELE